MGGRDKGSRRLVAQAPPRNQQGAFGSKLSSKFRQFPNFSLFDFLCHIVAVYHTAKLHEPA